MNTSRWSGLVSALAWFFFPLVPALLGSTYYQDLNGSFMAPGVKDPRDWDWLHWVFLTGPLIGYGFLAGATLDLPDEPGIRIWQGWFSRRSLWVSLGPWAGFVAWAGILLGFLAVDWAYPASRQWTFPRLPDGWWGTLVGWFMTVILFYVAIAYGWLPFAWAALRRARRLGRSLVRGLGFAVGFVGSLFGSFWAITEAWRSYFFDPRIVPALLAAATLALIAGCTPPETYGEVRRRDLFNAMLLAWLLGLALAWRWWSRSRPKP
jgi:hypothetical protein